MAAATGVSRGVSSRVSLGVSRNGENHGPKRRKPKGRGPGPYLVRSGSVYLFQIRVPKELGGGRGTRPIRISLGACPAKRARRLADLLAAEARARFERMRMMMDDENENGRPDGEAEKPDCIYQGDTLGEVLAEMRGELKMALASVSQPAPRMTPEEQRRAEGWKGLVEIGREVAKGEQGSRLVVDNAEVLKKPYVDKLMSTVSPLPEGAAVEAPKSFRQQPMVQPEVRAPAPADPEPIKAEAPRFGMAPEPDRPVAEAEDDDEDDEDDEDEHERAKERRFVPRKESRKPRFSKVARSYFKGWEDKVGKDNKDIRSARKRADLFIELIGDHPADSYVGKDLKAYLRLLKYWPGNNNERRKDWTAHQIIEDNRELRLRPLSMNSLRRNYIGIVRTIMAEAAVDHEFRNPFEKVRLRFPNTARPAKPTQPLSSAGISSIFRTGVDSGLLDEAMLPLLGYLTGRRLSLLVHLIGNDFREKYPGVWVAETNGIVKMDGIWKRVPFKTDASTGFFILHDFFHQIGFVEWARSRGDTFLFPELMKLEDPSKSASSYMQRLYHRAGVEPGKREVFHSFRSGNIEEMRDQQGNVTFALAERRKFERHDVDSVK